MVGREGEFHGHVLAILSSHPLQLLRVLDVHRLEEQRRNVRFFFSHKISSKGLLKKPASSATSSSPRQPHALATSCCISRLACLFLTAVKNMHYRDPAWWLWTYVARSTNRLSLLLAGARKFQLSFLLFRTPVLSRAGRQPSSTIARTFFA